MRTDGERWKRAHLQDFDNFVGDSHDPDHRDHEAHGAACELSSGRTAFVRKHGYNDTGGEPCNTGSKQ